MADGTAVTGSRNRMSMRRNTPIRRKRCHSWMVWEMQLTKASSNSYHSCVCMTVCSCYIIYVPWFCLCFEPLWCSWVCKRLWMSVLVWSRTPVWRLWHPATTWSGTRHWTPQWAPGWSQCQIGPPSGRQVQYPQRRLHSALGWTDGQPCGTEGRV